MTAPLCQVCHERTAHCGDPHLGPVCSDCYLDLIYARAAMEELSLLIGIDGCAPFYDSQAPASRNSQPGSRS